MTRIHLPKSMPAALCVVLLALMPAANAEQHHAPQDTPPSADEQPAGDAPNGDGGDTNRAESGSENSGDSAAETDSAEQAPADQESLDIDALRQEYLKLRDELFRSRARAAAVASGLYSTKLRIHLDYDSARFYTVTRSTVRLDGANVFDDAAGAIGTDRVPRFDGYVAPGRHFISVRVEAVGKDDDRFVSITDSTFSIQATAGKDIVVRVRARDAGDIPYAWEKREQGSYKLYLDVAVEAVERAAAATTSKATRTSSP